MKYHVIFKAFFIFIFAVFLQSLIAENSLAWKPPTHIFLSEEVVKDALEDGKVTLYVADYREGRILGVVGEYEVDPKILELIKDANVETTFRAGNFGPDAYPDPVTGGMVIHADYKHLGGPDTNDWLEYLWRRGYKGSRSPQIQAWVLGFMCHAAGDMYIHTFLNYFAGGVFSLTEDGDNPARHILLEGYIAKRQNGPAHFNVTLPDDVRNFIYENLINAQSGSELREKLLIADKGGKFSPPLRFMQLREFIQSYMINTQPFGNSINPNTKYSREWVKEIDIGLRALVDLSHDFGTTFLMPVGSEAIPSEVGLEGTRRYDQEHVPANYEKGKTSRTLHIINKYREDHLMPMLGFLKDPISEYQEDVRASVIGFAEKGMEEDLKLFRQEMKQDLFDYILRNTWGDYQKWGKTSVEALEFVRNPQTHFDECIAAASSQKNPDSKPVTMKETNHKYLKIRDDGYTNPAEKWQWEKFPPAFNTVQMVKLMFMKKEEINRMLDDLEYLISRKDKATIKFSGENAMLGFCASIDEGMSWFDKFFLTKDPRYYVQLFMAVTGEDPLYPECKVEFPPPPGGAITKVNITPGYMKDYEFKEFKPDAFIRWFEKQTVVNKNRQISDAPTQEEYSQIRRIFDEWYPVPEAERQKIKKGESLRITVQYHYWGYKKEEVSIKIAPNINIEKMRWTPFEKTEKFNAKDDFVKGEAKFDIPLQDIPKDEPIVGFDLLLNKEMRYRVHLVNAVEIKTIDEENSGLEASLAELEKLAVKAEERLGRPAPFANRPSRRSPGPRPGSRICVRMLRPWRKQFPDYLRKSDPRSNRSSRSKNTTNKSKK